MKCKINYYYYLLPPLHPKVPGQATVMIFLTINILSKGRAVLIKFPQDVIVLKYYNIYFYLIRINIVDWS